MNKKLLSGLLACWWSHNINLLHSSRWHAVVYLTSTGYKQIKKKATSSGDESKQQTNCITTIRNIKRYFISASYLCSLWRCWSKSLWDRYPMHCIKCSFYQNQCWPFCRFISPKFTYCLQFDWFEMISLHDARYYDHRWDVEIGETTC